MIERTKLVMVGAVAALTLAQGCQSTPKNDDAEPKETTATPEVSQEPEEAPADTAKGAMKTLQTIKTDTGEVRVTPLEHGSLILAWGERVIYVDPTTSALEARAGDQGVDALPKADLVLVTHIHGDHLDPKAIAQVRGEGAKVIAPQSVADEAGEALEAPTVLANAEKTTAFDGALEVEAVPMYNLVRKRDNGEFYHPKGRGNGYVLSVDGAKIYISGDTECTPEMKALPDIDAAFVSMNLPYTMPPEEAAECVRAFKPRVLFPYHYRGQDPQKLDDLLDDVTEVELRLLDWYAEGEESQ